MNVISVVGWHNVGKTTVIERLVAELKAQGLAVATIKHTREEIRVDMPGTDTWRFAEAGSDLVIIASAQRTMLIERRDKEEELPELLRRVPAHVDLVITEGYKRAPCPKIEVRRTAIGGEPISAPEELIAIVSDDPQPGASAPVAGFQETARLIALLRERGLLAP